MSLGESIGLAVGILAGMFALLFVLAAVEDGLFARVMEDPVAEATTDPVGEPEVLRQVA